MFSYRRRICNQRRLNGRISGFGGESGALSVSYGAGFPRLLQRFFEECGSGGISIQPCSMPNSAWTGMVIRQRLKPVSFFAFVRHA
jgi:hypothetical protein